MLYLRGRSQRDITDVLLIDTKTAGNIVSCYYETGKVQRSAILTNRGRERQEFCWIL